MMSNGENVAPIFPKEYEASYIAGLIAGEVSPNGQFATIGGFPNDAMVKLLDVYEATAVNGPRNRGLADAQATRAFANSWDDVALGKQMAESMIDSGADTLFVYANQVGLGSIQAAKEKGATFIGFSGDQNSVAPGTVPLPSPSTLRPSTHGRSTSSSRASWPATRSTRPASS
jgi:basic membrane protein A